MNVPPVSIPTRTVFVSLRAFFRRLGTGLRKAATIDTAENVDKKELMQLYKRRVYSTGLEQEMKNLSRHRSVLVGDGALDRIRDKTGTEKATKQ